jgi:glycosyltransferase involved in cell wall biosynthesis
MADFYVYMKHYRIEGVKTACFTHSDGFVFKMLLSYYPRLIGGCVDRKLQNIANYLMTEVDVKPCIAKIEEKNLLAQYPQLKGKTCLVVNAIDDLTDEEKAYTSKVREQEFPFKYRLVCAGGVHRRKGQYTVVTALNELTDEQLKDFHLTIVGDGTDRPVIEQYVKDNPRLTNHVEILGAVKNTEVYTKLAKCNIMVLMSGLEGLPIALIEGLRSGLALISTKVSGIPELIDEDVNGKLLNPNKEELVSLFKQFENYDWERMSKESRKLFEEYYVFTRMRSDYLKMLKKAFNE